MDELINDFIAETRDMLQALGGAIVAWEASPGDRKRLDEIFRFVHTVKGNCGFFDLPRLAALSHAAEDALAEVRAGRRSADSNLVSAVLAVIDRIGELVQALETGEALASEDDGMRVRIEVSDTGRGIKAEDISKIFEPYYSTKDTGTGLGLAIVRKAIDDHHGTISVKSKEGEGTTFTITLPVNRDI